MSLATGLGCDRQSRTVPREAQPTNPSSATAAAQGELNRSWTADEGYNIDEAQVQITLPLLDHLHVERIEIEIKEANVDEAVSNLLKQNGVSSLDERFLKSLGFNTVDELRRSLRNMMKDKIRNDVRESMRSQVKNYLLENTRLELPLEVSRKYASIAIDRRKLELLLSGKPSGQIKAQLEGAGAITDDKNENALKEFFILRAIAKARGVTANDADVDADLDNEMPSSYRLDRTTAALKQEMAADGTLGPLFIRVREKKTLDTILANAIIQPFVPKNRER